MTNMVKTVFEFYRSSNLVITDHERSLIRNFNHERELNEETLQEMFGDNFRQKLAKLVLRNEIEISHERLTNLICQDKEICKHFLLELVRRKHGAPID